MSDGLWERAPSWRWVFSLTVLISGVGLLVAPWQDPGTNLAAMATYSPPSNSAANLATNSGSAPSVPPVANASKTFGTGQNPAFDTPPPLPGSALPPGTKLHLIGVYQGAVPDGEAEKPWWSNCTGLQENQAAMMECHRKHAGKHTMRTITVDVPRSDGPVALVLMAYEPVKWKISAVSGSQIVKIFLGGYHGQDIEGVSTATPVEARTYEASPCRSCSRQSDYFYAYKQDSAEYRNTVKKLTAITGLAPSSFQGSYQANRFSLVNLSASNASLPPDSSYEVGDVYTGKTFSDQLRIAGRSVSLPEGRWQGLAYTIGPSKRGLDILIALGRRDGKPFRETIAIRLQIANDGNGFPQFSGCKNKPNYAGEVKTNESFGTQICFEVAHVTDAWAQPLLAMAKDQLRSYRVEPPDTVVASNFHKADLRESIDLLFYALPDTLSSQSEQWESSSWHPKRLQPGSNEALFVQEQVNWAAMWYQLFALSL